jgi:hypothetical protein
MKRHRVVDVLSFSLVALLGFCQSGASFGKPDDTVVSAQFSLENNRIVLGEPIVVDYKLTNISPAPVLVDLGENQTGWFRIVVQDSTGQPTPQIPDLRPTYRTGEILSPLPTCQLGPGASHEGQIVISQWFAIPGPGKYSVTAQVRVPNYPGLRPQESILSTEHSMSLTVLPVNLTHLRRTAQNLRRRADEEKNVSRLITTIEALYSMPEEVAFPFWRQLANSTSCHGHYWIIEQLKRLSTPAAALILAEMAQNSRVPETSQVARGVLRAMYLQAGPRTRSKIAPILITLDGQLPAIPKPPHQDE